ncbi:MAG: proliferating cell nuclear antigen (pcna) [Candidatus Woesearchaeota archaeon]|jgi:proliferating cell nuclear antigen|nr:proliferating cell nuclear antigen (pcna) [Candidatus Woesearchaeota archaeon]MDP7506091.1 proliferating cell nuclear antigen (pcna) [Candidatus Woesearchaeota archaeon]MDP7610558.1 proliferating cell nuclear antigen (pcna) [Candidatus Woesearchaeota archaeon]|tara:strand:+ start:617 stop:1357 length:741 start_codon:yes stop_codon:yes gene_type:complete
MKLSLAEPRYLKESISIISDLVNEARFKVTPDAIELVAMDPANVAMVIFKLLSSSFTEYNVDKEIDMAINLSNFKQILRRAKPEDILTLELEENKLKIQLKSNTTRTFSLPIIDLEEKEQKVPELKFPISIKTTSALLNDTIEDVDIVAESVMFQAEAKKFTILAEGDLSQAKIEVQESDETKITSTADNVKAKYSIEYLKKMIPASKLASEVTMQFDKDYPLKLEYTVVDKLQLAFVLAPRVENE